MKIVHICLSGVVTDGFSYQDNLLPKYHARLGYDVTFITSKWVYDESGEITRMEKSDYYNEDNVRMIRLENRVGEAYKKKFKHYIGLYSAIEKENPDILFIHGPQFLEMCQVTQYLKTHSDVMVYVDNHADFSNSGTNILSKYILQKIVWRRSAQKINPYTNKFYGVLPARVDWLIHMYGLPKGKCQLLVMGADDEKVEEAISGGWREKIREKYGIKQNDFLIMTGGKIDAAKAQTILLMEAVQKLEDPCVKLIVFGSVKPELQEKVHALADGNKIRYIGWVKTDESYCYWAAADLAVFPGRHSVYWEQVAGMGIPMICKYWEGTTHVDVGGNVRFLYQDSVDEILTEIQRVAGKSDEYNKMKMIAMERGKKMFSYEDIARRSISK